MTEKGLQTAYKNKPELLEEMLTIKPVEELCTLFDDEKFVEKGAGKTERFYEAITEKSIPDPSNDTTNTQSPSSPTGKKTYIAMYPIRCNGELIEANSEVSAEELGDDFERLLKIGAIGELLDRVD